MILGPTSYATNLVVRENDGFYPGLIEIFALARVSAVSQTPHDVPC